MQTNNFWLVPFDWIFILILIMVGVYSITFNVADATRLNHPKSAKVAHFGGWLCIAAALLIHITKWFITF